MKLAFPNNPLIFLLAGLNDGADADAESLSSLYNGQLHRLNKASHVTDGKLQENVRPSRLQRRVPAETVSARLTASLSHDSQPRKSSFDPKNLATTENFFAKPRTVQGLNSTINFQQPATLPTKVPSNFGDITEKTFKVDPSREITEAKVGVSAAAASDLNVLFNFEEVASECETNTTSIGYLGDLEGLVYEVDGISDATSPDDGSSHEATKGLASSMYAPQHTAASGLTLPTDVSNLPVSQDRTLQLGTGQYVQIRVFGSGPEISSFIAVVDQMATM